MKIKELKKTIQSSQEDFGKLAKIESLPNKRVRLLGLQMLKEGKKLTDVANALGVVYQTVKEWALRFIKNGLKGLEDLPGRGRKPFFPLEQKNALALEIEAMQQEKNGGRVTCKDIQLHLKEKYDVEYCLGGTYNLLDKFNIVSISGRSIHPKSNQEEQEEFKKNSKILLQKPYQKEFHLKM